MKIGILTYHKSYNYGAYMQALSLTLALQREGYDAELINYNSESSERYYKKLPFYFRYDKHVLYNLKRARMFENAVTMLPLAKEKSIITDDMRLFREYVEGKYDVIIVGSDEIWSVGGMRPFPNAYWLPEVSNVIKISYAASSKNNFEDLTREQQINIKHYLESFDYIGVRDRATVSLVESAMGDREIAHLNCDPTFACHYDFTLEQGRKLIQQKFHVDIHKPIVGLMVFDKEISDYIIKKYCKKIQIISLYTKSDGIPSNPNVSPIEWAEIIKGLDGLITTYFHGMCFALKGNTDFAVIEKSMTVDKKNSKIWDLAQRDGLLDHYISNDKTENMYLKIDDFVTKILKKSGTVDFTDICRMEKEKFYQFIEDLNKLVK